MWKEAVPSLSWKSEKKSCLSDVDQIKEKLLLYQVDVQSCQKVPKLIRFSQGKAVEKKFGKAVMKFKHQMYCLRLAKRKEVSSPHLVGKCQSSVSSQDLC